MPALAHDLDPIGSLARTLFAALREMDREATTEHDEIVAGLRWYSSHEFKVHPERRRKRWDDERAWCRRLRDLLPGRDGIDSVILDEPYPDRNRFCDLTIKAGPTLARIEVKGAWTYLWDWPELKPNRTYRKHLLTDAKESTLLDFTKVRTLRYPFATHIGVLLLGFDAEKMPAYAISDTDLNQLRERAAAHSDHWNEVPDGWSDDHQNCLSSTKREGFRVRCWFWHRAVDHSVER
jgi:hypothetical protein